MGRTIIPREDHSRHKGSGPVIEYKLDPEELEQYRNQEKKVDLKALKQMNITHFVRPKYVPEQTDEVEGQMSIYDLEGVT